ncbi:MAG TPA: C25 family cysteine peptidase, partial [Phycisphaerales bacterium]|nr:C25 family cysteine peptidase [Phycisphaerales bacterium]
VLAGMALSATSAMAQPAPPQWIALDSTAAPGSAPFARVNPASTVNETILDIEIPGFYVEEVVDPIHGTFHSLKIPLPNQGLGLLIPAVQKLTGSPAVPVINMIVALPSDAATCTVSSMTPTASMTFAGLRIIPTQPDVMEEPDVSPADQPPFTIDPAAYLSTLSFPAGFGEPLEPAGKRAGVRMQAMSVKPFKYTPATGQMEAMSRFSVVISHPGDPLPQTREHILLARQTRQHCVNWDTPAANWFAESVTYKGAYLFITRDDVLDDLKPLINQKKARGYITRVATQADVDTNADNLMQADEVRAYIKDWYESFPNEALKYVVLVGDVNRIPSATDPDYGFPSDLYYACYEDTDSYPDMRLGRITFNAGQLPDIISRIRAYQESPPASAAYYSSSAAIAHGEVAAKFVDVLDASISIAFPVDEPMNFAKHYGTDEATGMNSALFDTLNAGQHIVYYRGHGSTQTFFEWSFLGANFANWFLNTENNPVHPSWCPIVISSACSNGSLPTGDCLIEDWFQRPGNGAVAAYGALIGSRRDMNHGFTEVFWNQLRNIGKYNDISTHMYWSQLLGFIKNVKDDMVDPKKNLWTYVLLGDPETKIWARKPTNAAPDSLPPGMTGGASGFGFTVKNGHGDPIPGAVVCAYKPGEVQETVYADANGYAFLNVNPQTYGFLTVTTYTYDDSTAPTAFNIQVGACPADVDASGFVDTDDFDFFVRLFEAGDDAADFDGTGFVDTDDYDAFVRAFERGC